RKEEQKVHALARKRKAMAQGLYDSGIIVKIDLRQERGQRRAKDGSVGLKVRGEELALGVSRQGFLQARAEICCIGPWGDVTPPSDELVHFGFNEQAEQSLLLAR